MINKKPSYPKNWKKMISSAYSAYSKKLGHPPRCTVLDTSNGVECGKPINPSDWYCRPNTRTGANALKCVACAERVGIEVPVTIKNPSNPEKWKNTAFFANMQQGGRFIVPSSYMRRLGLSRGTRVRVKIQKKTRQHHEYVFLSKKSRGEC